MLILKKITMKKNIIYICSLLFFICFNLDCFGEIGIGMPLKYISSCEIDLNHDDEADIALLVETVRGRELIVLIKTAKGYNAYVVSKGKPNMHLSCHCGKYVKETSAGPGDRKGRVYETGGTYIQLTQPESSSVVYFWNNNKFQEVWTSD